MQLQDALVQSDKLGLKGFRKQLSGRFKRFVSRKPHEPQHIIPPELKPQLKTIYVYWALLRKPFDRENTHLAVPFNDNQQ